MVGRLLKDKNSSRNSLARFDFVLGNKEMEDTLRSAHQLIDHLTGFLLQQLDLLFEALDDLVGFSRPLLQPQQRVMLAHPEQGASEKPAGRRKTLHVKEV